MLREQKAALEADLRQAQASESAHLSGEDIAAWLDHIAQEPDAAEIIDTFVRLIEVDGEELKLYFAFDYWGDDFQPKQKRRTPKRVRLIIQWWRRRESNPRPLPCDGSALPTELRPQDKLIFYLRLANCQRPITSLFGTGRLTYREGQCRGSRVSKGTASAKA